VADEIKTTEERDGNPAPLSGETKRMSQTEKEAWYRKPIAARDADVVSDPYHGFLK